MSVDVGCKQFEQGSQSVAGTVVERVEDAASSFGVNEPGQSQTQEQQEEDILEFKVETEIPCVDLDCIVEEQSVVSRSTASGTVSPSTLSQTVDAEIKAETVDQCVEETKSVPIVACNSASDDVCSEQSLGIAKNSQPKQGGRNKSGRTGLCRKGNTTTRHTAEKVPAAAEERMDALGTGVTRKHTAALARTSAQHTSNSYMMPESPGANPSKPVVRRSAVKKPIVHCAKKRTQQTHKKQSIVHAKPNAGKSGQVHKCKECGVCYGKAPLLQNHMKTKHTVSAHKCNICDKYFASAQALKVHMSTVHLGAKPFQWGKCGKGFGQKGVLTRHIEGIHEGQKFGCETCGKKFSHKISLIRHASVHSGEKPYVCEICGSRFSDAFNLTTHRRRHLQIKPHHCPKCDMAFVSSCEVKSHVRRVHPMHMQ